MCYGRRARARSEICSRKARSAERKTEKEKLREKREREREKEREQGERARSCAMDGALARALKHAPERRAQGALCREKDREREA